MEKFGAHRFRRKGFFEQPGKNIDGADQHQIAQGAGICDGGAHGVLKSKPIQRLQLAAQFLWRDAIMNVMLFQESIDFMAGLESEQPPEIWFGQTASAVFLGGERLQRAAFEVGAIGGEAGGEVIGKMHGQIHEISLAWRDGEVKSPMIKDVIIQEIPPDREEGVSF